MMNIPATVCDRVPLVILPAILLIVGLLHVTDLPAQNTDEKIDHFYFHWPVGMTAHVEKEKMLEYGGSMQRPGRRSVLRYRMTVTPHESGLLLSLDSISAARIVDGREQPMPRMLQPIIEAAQPDIVIDPSGTFLGVANLDDIRAILDSIVNSFPKSVREVVANMDMEAAIIGEISQDWDAMIHEWQDAVVEVNRSDTMRDYKVNALLPALEIPMTRIVEPMEWTACSPDDKGESCLKIRVHYLMDTATMREKIVEIMQLLGSGTDADEMDAALRTLDMKYSLTMVIEPDGMRPHMFMSDKSFTATTTFSESQGDDTETELSGTKRELQITRYTYDRK